MKLKILAGGLLFLGTVGAHPQYDLLRHHAERDVKVIEEVLEVVWEVVTATSMSTMTVWVNGDGTSVPSPASAVAGEFFQTAPSFSTRFITTSISDASSVYVAPPPPSSSANVVPTAAAPSPVIETTTPAPYVAPTSAAAPVIATSAAAPVVATSAAAPVVIATAAAAPVSNYNGACSSSSPCTGDITYYEAGMGACGTINNGNSEMVIALPYQLMGTQSNGNPYCGKTVTINANQHTVIATVVDKCMGCTGYSIDLSNAAFLALGYDLGVGRTTATWYFN